MKSNYCLTLEPLIEVLDLRRLKVGDIIIQKQEDNYGVAKIVSEYDSTKTFLEVGERAEITLSESWHSAKNSEQLLERYLYLQIQLSQATVLKENGYAIPYQLNIEELLTFGTETFRFAMQPVP